MVAPYSFREFQESQLHTLNRAVEACQACLEAQEAARPLKGGMHWKKIRGREYLYKYRDRLGHGASIGPRSPHTEALFRDFSQRRRENAARLDAQRQELAAAARFCRAARLHRVPDLVVRVLRYLNQGDLPGAPLLVIDTHALHAFEFAAGAFIDPAPGSSLWSGAGRGLTLAARETVSPEEFFRCLRRADRSFQSLPGDHLAALNKHGFRVRCLDPLALRSPHPRVPRNGPGLTVPAESGDLSALLAAPKFSQVAIGRRGDPVVMAVPDPRALALHKLWLSQQEDRDPGQRLRDRHQALALAELILRYLPPYHFFAADLRFFPAEVARLAEDQVEGYELPPDLEAE